MGIFDKSNYIVHTWKLTWGWPPTSRTQN